MTVTLMDLDLGSVVTARRVPGCTPSSGAWGSDNVLVPKLLPPLSTITCVSLASSEPLALVQVRSSEAAGLVTPRLAGGL